MSGDGQPPLLHQSKQKLLVCLSSLSPSGVLASINISGLTEHHSIGYEDFHVEHNKNRKGDVMQKEPRKEVTIPVSIRVTPEELAFIDVIADELGIARSKVARNIFQAGLEDAKMLQAVGILPTAGKLLEVKDRLKEAKSRYLNSLRVKAK